MHLIGNNLLYRTILAIFANSAFPPFVNPIQGRWDFKPCLVSNFIVEQAWTEWMVGQVTHSVEHKSLKLWPEFQCIHCRFKVGLPMLPCDENEHHRNKLLVLSRNIWEQIERIHCKAHKNATDPRWGYKGCPLWLELHKMSLVPNSGLICQLAFDRNGKFCRRETLINLVFSKKLNIYCCSIVIDACTYSECSVFALAHAYAHKHTVPSPSSSNVCAFNAWLLFFLRHFRMKPLWIAAVGIRGPKLAAFGSKEFS